MAETARTVNGTKFLLFYGYDGQGPFFEVGPLANEVVNNHESYEAIAHDPNKCKHFDTVGQAVDFYIDHYSPGVFDNDPLSQWIKTLDEAQELVHIWSLMDEINKE